MKRHYVFSGPLALAALVALFLLLLPMPAGATEQWQHYMGQLHAHSGDTDLIGSPEAVFAAAKDAGLHFFALTDYSHSFENAADGSLAADGSTISTTWSSGKAAAEAATAADFVGLYGFEMAWPRDLRLGHMVTLATPGWQTGEQAGFSRLESYYTALTSVDSSIAMFCHPGEFYGDFQNFGNHRWDYDDHIALVEISGENGQLFLDAYQNALDLGWHVAPAANGASHHLESDGISPVRTGILAKALTEESIYGAILARRVYATLDPALKIDYYLDSHIMGSRATSLNSCTATFQLSDPRGTVEIVSSQAEVVASCAASETSLALPAGYPYYYLRVIRDGEILAVTAPVWVDIPTDFGAGDLTASSSVPVQNQAMTLSFSLFNHEKWDLTLNSLSLSADETVIWSSADTLGPGSEKDYAIPYTHTGAGTTKFRLEAAGTIAGNPVAISREMTLSYRPAVLNAHILVDGCHSSVSSEDLENLVTLSGKADMDVAIFREELPGDAKILIVPSPDRAFSENYPRHLAAFVEKGGILILCGRAENNSQLNSLLADMGATMSLNNDRALDPVNNGGSAEQLFPDVFNTSQWENLTGNAFYSHLGGCTVDPGSGTWLVRGEDTMTGTSQVLLAKETIGQGRLYLAGSFFLNDDHMPLPANHWDVPRANQLLLESILGLQRSRLPITGIKALRSGTQGDFYRIQGYVTAGTSDEHNRFPKLIYLQDQTGGIEITHFEIPDIEVGVRLDITGQLTMDGKNPALKLISCETIPHDLYRFAPDRLFHAASMNYERHGGELMKVEGIATDIEYTSDGLGVRRFRLIDPLNNLAEVLVEDSILSGAHGVNQLAEEVLDGENTRAYGILHLEENGNPVLRVRNCDEVTNIPPVPEIPDHRKEDPTNPKTGDVSFTFAHFWSTMFQKE